MESFDVTKRGTNRYTALFSAGMYFQFYLWQSKKKHNYTCEEITQMLLSKQAVRLDITVH